MQKLLSLILFGLLCGQLNAQSTSSIVYEPIPTGHPSLEASTQKKLVYYAKEVPVGGVLRLRLTVNDGKEMSLTLPGASFATAGYAGGEGLSFLLAADKLKRKAVAVQLFPIKDAVDGIEAVQWLTALEKAAKKGPVSITIKEAKYVQRTTVSLVAAAYEDQWDRLRYYEAYVEAYERLKQKEERLLNTLEPLTKPKALALYKENIKLKAKCLQLDTHIQIYLLQMKGYIDLAPTSDLYVRRTLANLFLLDTQALPDSIPEATTEYETLLDQLNIYPELKEGLIRYVKAKVQLSTVLMEQDGIESKWKETEAVLSPIRARVEELMQINKELNTVEEHLAIFK